LTKSGDF